MVGDRERSKTGVLVELPLSCPFKKRTYPDRDKITILYLSVVVTEEMVGREFPPSFLRLSLFGQRRRQSSDFRWSCHPATSSGIVVTSWSRVVG